MAYAVMNMVPTTPENATSLAAELEAGTFGALESQPGFRAARLYRSLDDTQVVTITEWESQEDFQRYRETPEAKRMVAGLLRHHPKISFHDVVAVRGGRGR